MSKSKDQYYFLNGYGEMGTHIRNKDWCKNILGTPGTWPQSLQTTLSIILNSKFPMFLCWGTELTCFYNDDYLLSLGNQEKHPEIVGQKAEIALAEIWSKIKPFIKKVMKGQGASWNENQLIPVYRNNKMEDVYWNFSYSPVYDESQKIAGVMVICNETTKSVVAYNKLKESEERFKTMADNIPNLAWMAKADGTLYWYNKKWFEYTGTSFKDMQGWGWQSVYKKEELPEVIKQWKNSLKVGVPFEMLRAIKAADGSYRQFITRALPVKNATGEIVTWFGTSTDITDQKQIEAALEESKKQLEFVLDAAKLGTFDYNLITNKFIANNRLKKWFGLQLIQEIKLTDATNVIIEDDRPKVIIAIQNALDYLSGGNYDITYTIINPISKKKITLQAKGKAWFNDNKIAYRLNGTIEDITLQTIARQKTEKSEQNIRSLVESAPFPIGVYTGREMRITFANQSIIDTWGKGNNIVGKLYREVLPELENQSIYKQLEEVFTTGIAFHAKNQRVDLEKDGNLKTYYFNYSFTPLLDALGNVYGIMNTAAEVTELHEAKKKIEESEKRFREAVQQAPTAMVIFKGKNNIVEIVNTSYLELVDKTENEFLGKPLFESLPETEQAVSAIIEAIYRTGKAYHGYEFPVELKRFGKKEISYFNFVYHPLIENTIVTGVIVAATEVTATVTTKKALQENEQKLNIVINASELGIWELEFENNNTTLSKRALEILGIKNHNYKNHQELIGNFHPNDLAIRKAAMQKAIETGVLYYEVRTIINNEIRWIEAKGKVFYSEDNKPVRMLGTLRDISEQKNFQNQLLNREQKFKLLADSMPQFIWTADPEGNLNYFNQSVFDFSGYSEKDINKNGWLQIVHPEEREENIIKWMESITTEKDFLIEHRFRKSDGTYRWQLSRAIPQRDLQGKITMWVGTSTDIQDQKMFTNELEKQVSKRTKELYQKNDDLKKMNKELQSFAYISSHDLQEPLRKIQIFATQINEKEVENLSESGKDKFKRMQNAANRMQTLIQDLLAYSRTSIQERKFEHTQLSVLIEEVKDDLNEELLLKKAKITVTNDCDIKVIPFQFRQLLFNLINNSIKFTKSHTSPEILIECAIGFGAELQYQKLDKKNKYCHISITDNGIGFEKEYHEKIFEVFQRLHGKETYNGTGIGLAIVKKIVDNHNGFIKANGVINQGATFDIYLPV